MVHAMHKFDADPDMKPDLLSVSGLKKHFGGVKALDGVDLKVKAGSIHALVGENGAGKSTLIKVLTGVHRPSDGTIRFAGNPFHVTTPNDAKSVGIQVVHQEFNLLGDLSVAENISIEAMPKTRFGLLDRRKMIETAKAAMASIGLEGIDVRAPVHTLGIAHQQLVEIARALQSDSRLLILDEPTATLTERETVRLFEIVRRVQADGVTILFVSHHLNEVFEICDEVTVFRNGKTVATEIIAKVQPKDVVRHMVGRDVDDAGTDRAPNENPVTLDVAGLQTTKNSDPAGVSFKLRKGEILGIAGLVGAGRSEVLRALFGIDPKRGGTVALNGTRLDIKSPADSIKAGIGFVTEDRKTEGLILSMSIASNVSLVNLRKVSRGWTLRQKAEAEQARARGTALNLKYGKTADAAASLSGGNQQKVVLAKWLANTPDVLLLDEPTRGVDVGAKFEIYTILQDLAAKGVSMVVVSSELPELMTLADRILVLNDHKVMGELARKDFAEEPILRLAYGQKETV